MRALVTGHFSTAGDLEVLRQVLRQLHAAALPYDLGAFAPEVSTLIPGAVDIYGLDPLKYTHLFVVCGPFDTMKTLDLDKFAHCTRIGVNLTMLEKLEIYNPFDALLGRDSNHWVLPDISFLERVLKVKVAGLCFARDQSEYGIRQMHAEANDLLRRLALRSRLATTELDTEWYWPAPHNAGGWLSPEHFESLVSRLDVMLTTRLHGMVLSLKNGVPVVALDAIAGGAKVIRQARAIGWPEAFVVDEAIDGALDQALVRCLKPSARDRALSCAAAARESLASFHDDFAQALERIPQCVTTSVAPLTRPAPWWQRANFREIATKLSRRAMSLIRQVRR